MTESTAPPRLDATLVELHFGPAIDLASFPVSLQATRDAFQFDERWQRILDANERFSEVNGRLKTLKTDVDRLKKALDERESEARVDYEERIAGKNEAERNAKLFKVLKADAAYQTLKMNLQKAEDERNELSTELEKLESSMRSYLAVSEEIGRLMQLAAISIAAPKAAAAYLS